jgi:hypothetical protein
MALIGMSEAAKRAGLSGPGPMRTSLQNAGVPLVVISANSFAVEEADLEAYIASRGGALKPGRPRNRKKSEGGAGE